MSSLVPRIREISAYGQASGQASPSNANTNLSSNQQLVEKIQAEDVNPEVEPMEPQGQPTSELQNKYGFDINQIISNAKNQALSQPQAQPAPTPQTAPPSSTSNIKNCGGLLVTEGGEQGQGYMDNLKYVLYALPLLAIVMKK
jgi:hypothetical protein